MKRKILTALILILALLLSGYTIGGKKPIVITTPAPVQSEHQAKPTQKPEGYWIDMDEFTPEPTGQPTQEATEPAYPPPPIETPGYPAP